ncbi:MAG: DUF3089 domain-containing protein [Myxococcota bacterium]
MKMAPWSLWVVCVVGLGACSPAMFLRPKEDFDAERLVAPPDYEDPGSWAALPTKQDAADMVPPGSEDVQAAAPADVFFVHPTVWFDRRTWNDTLDNEKSLEMVDEIILSGQASAFNGCCRVFAPRYRQTTIGAFYAEDFAQAEASFDVAYSDVERAFDVFLSKYNGERPFILAGHSQGSMHLMRLLERVAKDPDLRGRLVAAYIPGFAHPMSRFETAYPELTACTAPEQTGCVAAWDTYRQGARVGGHEPLVFWFGEKLARVELEAPRQCTNPVTWAQDGKPSPQSEHQGAVLPANTGNEVKFTKLLMSDHPIGAEIEGLEAPRAKMISAQCVDGVLRVPDVSALDYPVQETQRDN